MRKVYHTSNDPQPSAKEIVFEEEDPKLEEEMSNTYRFEEIKKVGIQELLIDETQERQDDELMFDTGVLDTDEMHVEAKVIEKDEQSTKLDDSTAGKAVTTASVEDSVAPTTIKEITLAQTLIQIKAAKPKVVTIAATTTTTTRPKDKGVVVQEPSEFRVPQEAQPSISKDKGKGIMVEPEVPLKRKDQIALDEQIARDIQAKLDAEIIEEQKLARKQEEEANIALIESWENTQAMMEADRLLAERLQSKEREELTDEEKGKLFMELIEKRRKHFAALKAQEKRNRPPTKAQKRTQMSTYLKHMGKQRKEGSEQTAKGSRKKMLGRKRAIKEQQQESLKKQRIEEDKESNEVDEVSKDDEGELMKHLVIKKDEDIAIDAIPLATKLPMIIDYKLHKEAEPIPPTSSVTALRIPMIKKGEYDLCHNDSWSASDQNFTAANARRNNEKALNILLSAIPDRHLLSFHDATNAKTLWTAIKARFGGNEASKKMQKNLLKQQFETFTIGSREELDSAYERFQNILSMLELYDAKVSLEDANLKFLRSLPSVWHVVATMIRGQPGLDELEFDDLYNNLKVYEHELKGVSSSSQNIAFLSTEVKGSTLKQSTADPANIPKGYTQAASSKDSARIRKFDEETGRPIDLSKPKIGDNFDKANGRNEKRIVAIEDSNSKALVATDNNEDIDWTKEIKFALGTSGLVILTGATKADDHHYPNWKEKLSKMEYDLKLRDLKLEEKQKELDQVLKERDDFKDLGLSLVYGIDELAIRNKVLNQENTKSSQPEIDRNKVIIEDWVDSDDEETVLNSSDIQKKTVLNSENSETSFVTNKGSRDTRPVWNNIQRVNHSNFSGNSRYPHQRRSFIPSAVLTREGLKSTARPNLTRTVPFKSTANVFYQGTARPRVPQAVLSQSTGRPYYPRMDNIRPRTSSFSPSTRSSTTRTPHRPQRPKKIMKSIWVKKESTVGSQTVLPKIVSVKGSAMINQTWRPKGAYLDSVNRDNGSYTLKQFEYGNPEEDLKDYAIIDSGMSGKLTGDKDKCLIFKSSRVVMWLLEMTLKEEES
ncbi:hypothetical protein Tco_1326441 [Tanacetum coccineum]